MMIGVFIVALCAIILTNYLEFETYLPPYLKPIEIALGVGVITIIISFLGCMGALQESILLVNLHAFFLFLVVLVELGLLITAYVLRGTIGDEIMGNMNSSLLEYKWNRDVKILWDFTQETLRCCGISNPYSWYHQHVDGPLISYGRYMFKVPYSCCSGIDCNQIYTRGCWKVLSEYVRYGSSLLMYSIAGFILIKFLAVALAFPLARTIRRVKTEREMLRQNFGYRSDEEMRLGDQVTGVVNVHI